MIKRIINLKRMLRGTTIMISVKQWHHPMRDAFDFRDSLATHCEMIEYKNYKLSELREIIKNVTIYRPGEN